MNILSTVTVLLPHGWRGAYAIDVLKNGHIPTVLSGANLRGKARRYGGRYAYQRRRLVPVVAAVGVCSALVLGANRRLVRVWVDAHGSPVRLLVERGETK